MFKRKFFILFVGGAMLLSACMGSMPQGGQPPLVQSQPTAGPDAPASTDAAQPVQDSSSAAASNSSLTYPIVDTNQTACYDNDSTAACPNAGEAFNGQDGNYQGLAPTYQDNGDGTITDLNTGLMWLQSPDLNGDGTINSQDKMTSDNALSYADSFSFAGYDDWRLPSIKELYSLIEFTGYTGIGDQSMSSAPSNAIPYLDTRYFKFGYGDANAGERYIDAQFASSTKYVSTTMNNEQTMFGVNFADGRIKGYGIGTRNGRQKTFYVLYVRGKESYGKNN